MCKLKGIYRKQRNKVKTTHYPITEKYQWFSHCTWLLCAQDTLLSTHHALAHIRWTVWQSGECGCFHFKQQETEVQKDQDGEWARSVRLWGLSLSGSICSGYMRAGFYTFSEKITWLKLIEMELFPLLFVNSPFWFENIQWTFCAMKYSFPKSLLISVMFPFVDIP